MEQQIFRKNSLDRVSSPEQLSDYLRVTSPAIWVVLAAVILFLACLFAWASVTAVESYVSGTAEVRNGVLTLAVDDSDSPIEEELNLIVRVGDLESTIRSAGRDQEGRLLGVALVDLPDGQYQVRVSYKTTQILELLFN